MRRSWLIFAIVMMLVGVAHADPPADAAVDARIKALEQRVLQLEQRLRAITDAQVAAPAGTAAPSAAAPAGTVVLSPAAPAQTAPARWKDHGAWSQLERGMSWSQVSKILGMPGEKKTGVFGDVWFYPDGSGGRVVFDRDSRVSSWTEPQ